MKDRIKLSENRIKVLEKAVKLFLVYLKSPDKTKKDIIKGLENTITTQ